jgi:DNA-binding response OmpR family regulator
VLDDILIIDGNYSSLQLISKFLESAGFKTYQSLQGEDALRRASLILPSLIICNIVLPEMSGYDILKRLLSDDKTASIPFIFLAHNNDLQEVKKAMTLGADCYITRPFNAAELISIIKTKLKKQKLIKRRGLDEYIKDNIDRGYLNANETILLNVDKRKKLIKKNDIEYITALGPYTNLFIVGKGIIQVRKLLKLWECILPEENFIKIHRSAIVNSRFIKEIERCSSRALLIKMENSNKTFITSQRYSVRVRSRFQLK